MFQCNVSQLASLQIGARLQSPVQSSKLLAEAGVFSGSRYNQKGLMEVPAFMLSSSVINLESSGEGDCSSLVSWEICVQWQKGGKVEGERTIDTW